MIKHLFVLLSVPILACGIARAATVTFSTSGQFSNSDTAGSLVAPGGLFSLSFNIDTTALPLAGSVTSLGFDFPETNFRYSLNGAQVSATPTELRFDTSAIGGGFDLTFGSLAGSPEFSFQGAQLFTGTTAAPLFATGTFNVTSWLYSDNSNFDAGPPSPQAITVATAAPESSTFGLFSLALAAIALMSSRLTSRQAE